MKTKARKLLHDYYRFFSVLFVKSCRTMEGAELWNSGLGRCDLYYIVKKE